MLEIKKMVVAFVVLIQYQMSFSQTGTLKGIIYSRGSSIGIPYVNVYLPDIKKGVSADSIGNFEIRDIKFGDYEIAFSLVGYKDTAIKNVRIFQDSVVELKIYFSECSYDVLGKSNICPICKKSDSVVPIVYGKSTNKMFKKEQKGEIKLAGCIVRNCQPNFHCVLDVYDF